MDGVGAYEIAVKESFPLMTLSPVCLDPPRASFNPFDIHNRSRAAVMQGTHETKTNFGSNVN